MRVIHLIDHLGLGGAQAALLELALGLKERSVDISVACLHGRGSFFDALRAGGVPVDSLSPHRFQPAYLPGIVREVRPFDILHAHLQFSSWLGAPLARISSPQTAVILHDHASGDLRFRGIASLLPDAWGHLWSDRIIAVSEGVRDFRVRWQACPTDDIHVIPNGINCTAFAPAPSGRRIRAREALGIREDEFVVGAVGRLAPEKNFGILARVSDRLPGARFLVAGAGPCRGRLEGAFAGRPIRLLGHRDDRAGFYAALDAFVLPSLYEGLPMVLLEAMACGLPIVASRLPDIGRTARDEQEALLIHPAEPDEIAAALRRIRQDPALAKNIGNRARRRCEKHFSSRKMVDSVISLYRQILEDRSG